MPDQPSPSSRRHCLPHSVRWLAALIVAATWAWADDRPAASEGIDDIERRIRQQRKQDLKAVRTLMQTLVEQSKAQRGELQRTEKELAQARAQLSLLGEVPEPLEPSTVGAAPTDGIPRPSPGSPVHSPRADSSARRTEPGLPFVPDSDRAMPKQDLLSLRARVRHLTEKLREQRRSVQRIEAESSRARGSLDGSGMSPLLLSSDLMVPRARDRWLIGPDASRDEPACEGLASIMSEL
jgi:hypothetical protein